MQLPKTKTTPSFDLSTQTVIAYGGTKVGKSTFFSKGAKTLFLATEPGLNNLATFMISISTWEEFLEAAKLVATTEHDYDTVCVDTADIAYRLCTKFICDKYGVSHPTEIGDNRGYTLVNNELFRVFTKLACLKTGLVIISHSKTFKVKERTGEFNKTSLSLPGGPTSLLLGLADIVLYFDNESTTDDKGVFTSKTVIRTKPTKFYDAGDRTTFLPETIVCGPDMTDAYKVVTDALNTGKKKGK